MKITKSFFLIPLLFALEGTLSVCAAETVDLVVRTTAGDSLVRRVERDCTRLCFADSDAQDYRIAGIGNLGFLPKLESVEMYCISGITDWSFLLEAKGLRALHRAMCTVPDLAFVEKLESLEYLCLDVYSPAGTADPAGRTELDLGKLGRLKFIEFCPDLPSGVPRFRNVRNRPFINLNNNRIRTVSPEEVNLLSQYSLVSLQFNPICENQDERAKLAGLKVCFDASDPWPPSVTKYTLNN